MTAPVAPLYHTTVKETGVVPEHIYAHCVTLMQFNFEEFTPVRRSLAPRPGQKPTRKKSKR